MRVRWVVVWQLMEGRGAQEPEAGTARSLRVRKRVGESSIGLCADSERLPPKSSHFLLFREWNPQLSIGHLASRSSLVRERLAGLVRP